MKHVQPNALLEQAIDIRSARTLYRDGWSCEQINNRVIPRRTARGALGRDIFILTFMATVALTMMLTLL